MDAQLYINGTASQVTDGPVIGTDEPALHLNATAYLTTGDLSPGDSGDAGILPGFSVECWLRVSQRSIGTVNLLRGPTAHPPTAHRQYAVTISATGTVSFTFRDATDTDYTVTSTTAVPLNTWTHITAVYLSNTIYIYFNGVQNNTAAAGGVPWGSLVTGSADFVVGDSASTIALELAEVAFFRSGLSASRVLAHYQAGAQRGFPEEATVTRVMEVLDLVDSAAPRGGETSSVANVTPRYMTGQPALDLIREMVSADVQNTADPCFFVSAGGTLTWLSGSHRGSSPWNTVQATFGDQGSELAYESIDLDYSDSYLVNEVNVTREGTSRVPGVMQSASDATSISRYGRRTLNIAGIPFSLDALSGAMADGLLAKYKDPLQRILSITLSALDPEVALAAFQREIADKITILRTPPGGGLRIQQDVWIQKIEVSGTNDGTPISIRWAVSPL